MSSRWGDAAMYLLTFETQSWEGPDGTPDEARATVLRSQALLVHRFSLLHAVAMQALRRDASLMSLEAAIPSANALTGLTSDDLGHSADVSPRGAPGVPACNAAMRRGTARIGHDAALALERMGNGAPMPQPNSLGTAMSCESDGDAHNRGSQVAILGDKAHVYGEATAGASRLHAGGGHTDGAPCPRCGRVWCACEGEEPPPPPPRTGRIPRSRKSSSAKLRSSSAWRKLPVLGGVRNAELAQLLAVTDRAALVYAQLTEGIIARRAAGGYGVDSPVFALALYNLATGAEGFRQARRLEDIPFPFPYGQMLSFMLFCFGILYPIVTSLWVGDAGVHPWAAPLLTFITMLLLVGLYKVARELEDPFAHPPNDLPSCLMQTNFNERLLDAWKMVSSARSTPGEQADETSVIEATLRRHAPSTVTTPLNAGGRVELPSSTRRTVATPDVSSADITVIDGSGAGGAAHPSARPTGLGHKNALRPTDAQHLCRPGAAGLPGISSGDLSPPPLSLHSEGHRVQAHTQSILRHSARQLPSPQPLPDRQRGGSPRSREGSPSCGRFANHGWGRPSSGIEL
mmetsp:Transcript_23496/g.71904  ORF Transcript_23496/g.71904 Transcript_23496/m.71904 type:complete len:573 (+) Transcript_23496:605-2323(+)